MNSLRLCLLVGLWCLPLSAQEPINPTYPADIEAPPGFRANRSSYSAIMDVLGPKRPAVSQQDLDRLKQLQFETIWGRLGEYKSNYVRGFKPTQPGKKLVGRAVTIRYLPPRSLSDFRRKSFVFNNSDFLA